jgi:hypothetical protein
MSTQTVSLSDLALSPALAAFVADREHRVEPLTHFHKALMPLAAVDPSVLKTCYAHRQAHKSLKNPKLADFYRYSRALTWQRQQMPSTEFVWVGPRVAAPAYVAPPPAPPLEEETPACSECGCVKRTYMPSTGRCRSCETEWNRRRVSRAWTKVKQAFAAEKK